MKNKKLINNLLLIGILFIGVLFIVGSSEKQDSAPSASSIESKVNSLDDINKQKYRELEKQLHRTDAQAVKYLNERKRIKEKNHYGAVYKDRSKQNKYLDNLDIKLGRTWRKEDSIQAKMDNILKESTKTCFPKNTKVVMFDGSLKNIDTIVKGDKVMIYDIANDVISEASVNKKFINTNNHLYIINDDIKTTSYERFLTKDGWKRTHDLSTKDSIFNGNSFVKVDSIYKVKKDLTVYNLNINSTHNFFVSFKNNDEWFLIHNCGGEGGGK